jgi:acetyl esterase/lipase
MLDDRTAVRRDLDGIEHWVWSNTANRVGWAAYLGIEPGAETVPPYAAPARRLDLSGLPPAWLDYGSIELFRDEIVDYAARLKAAGVPVVIEEVPGAPHGFETWAADSAPARAILERARAWLGDLFATEPVR